MIRLIVVGCLLTASNAWPQPQIQAVVNAASFQPGLPAGGGLATVFFSGANPPWIKAAPGTYLAPPSSGLPYELGGLRVLVNDALAPILAVVIPAPGGSAYAQINFQVPLERNASLRNSPEGYPGFLKIAIAETGEGPTITPLPAVPWGGVFSDATGFAIVQHALDYSPVTPQNPAHPGETIVAYADDFYPVWPPPPIGVPTPQQLLFQIISASVAISGNPGPGFLYLQDYPQPDFKGNSFTHTPALQITFEGLAPGQIGVEQINFVVPANQQPGDWALFFNVGSCPDGTGSRCTGIGRSSPSVKLPVR